MAPLPMPCWSKAVPWCAPTSDVHSALMYAVCWAASFFLQSVLTYKPHISEG